MHSVGCYAISSQCKIRLARLEQQLQRWRWLQNWGGGRVFATVNVKQSICCVFIDKLTNGMRFKGGGGGRVGCNALLRRPNVANVLPTNSSLLRGYVSTRQ